MTQLCVKRMSNEAFSSKMAIFLLSTAERRMTHFLILHTYQYFSLPYRNFADNFIIEPCLFTWL